MKEEDARQYLMHIKDIAAFYSIIMMVVIYNSVAEADSFVNIYQSRYYSIDTHGLNMISYASKVSLYSTAIIFINNFGIFMVFFQLAMQGFGFSMSFQLPLILQFIILFFYSNRILTLQIRIQSLDKFTDEESQSTYAHSTQLKIYLLALIFTVFSRHIITSNFWSIIVMGSIWVPQIIRNSIHGFRHTPTLSYGVW